MVNISEYLTSMELAFNIDILYACECGSRAYGYAKENSDYDVRFVYKRKLPHYLSIRSERSDVIEHRVNELDIVGWDIIKFCKQLYNGNASPFEWMHSDIIYKDDGIFKKTINNNHAILFQPTPIINHYYHWANNHLSLLNNETHKKYKACCIIARAVLMMLHIDQWNTYPVSIDVKCYLFPDFYTKYKLETTMLSDIFESRKQDKPLTDEALKAAHTWCTNALQLFHDRKNTYVPINRDSMIKLLDQIIYERINSNYETL